MARPFPSEASADSGEHDADPGRSRGLQLLARLGAGVTRVVRRRLASLVGSTGSLDWDVSRKDVGLRNGGRGHTPRLPFDATGPGPSEDRADSNATSAGPTTSGSDTTKPMIDTQRRGTCARCGLEFDAERGYTALDVLKRDAEDPRSNSTERTIRLCDVCSEDFRDFVELGRNGTPSTVPEFLPSR